MDEDTDRGDSAGCEAAVRKKRFCELSEETSRGGQAAVCSSRQGEEEQEDREALVLHTIIRL